jgi:DNA modification methylase
MNDISGTNWRVMFGSCLDRLKDLEDNSLDSVVTDPPYELAFMGKSWDSSGIAYNVEVWRECLRVLKPGGHVLAFGGSRTWHRLAVAVEDAGFEIRDSIAWIYGSGFPKSLDVSKAIDKRGGVIPGQSRFAGVLKRAKSQTSLTISDLNEVLGRRTSNLWSHFVSEIQPLLPTVDQYWKLKSVLPIPDEWDIQFLPEAEREVIGQKMSGIADKNEKGRHTIGASKAVEVDVTLPATSEAKAWEGWGTALKPAHEPVVVGRKPLTGTVAANVLEWGVGGLNIDGTRIAGEVPTVPQPRFGVSNSVYEFGSGKGRNGKMSSAPAGRWPSNVMLDEFTARLVDEQSGVRKSPKPYKAEGYKDSSMFGIGGVNHNSEFGDSGGASRFFYVAKASKRDRNEGLEQLEAKANRINAPRSNEDEKFANVKQNFHPTVKPTELMRNLIRLVTPLGGTVLDPFTGSGSTGKAAILEGMQFVGVELTEEYLPIIQGRLNHAVKLKAAQELKDDEALF